MPESLRKPAVSSADGSCRHAALACLCLMLAVGCAVSTGGCRQDPAVATSRPAAATDDTTVIRIGGESIKVEVVATDMTRQRGLMYRQSLAADAGMVFVFTEPRVQRFWMKDTSIPLDIVYLDGEAKIVSIKQMRPYDLESVSSDQPAKYAIELNQGAAERLLLKVGDKIELPPRITTPPELE